MRAVDTNVLVRLVVRDDAAQVAAAERFIETGAWVSHVVLVETVWVLQSAYGVKPPQVAAWLKTIIDHDLLVLQEPAVVSAALEQFRKRPAVELGDYLIIEIARAAGHVPVGTFDRTLAKVDGAVRVV